MKYGHLPPPGGPVLAPMASSNTFKTAMSLWAPCRPLSTAVQTLVWRLAGVGTWLLPTLREDLVLNDLIDGWEPLATRLTEELGPFDQVALYRPTQASRTGFAVLLIANGGPFAFVKVGPVGEVRANEDPSSTQALVLSAVAGSKSFWSPRPVASGQDGTWSFLAMEPLPRAIHRPCRGTQFPDMMDEIESRLSAVLPKRGVPSTWRPMHGDLGPWNLRDVVGMGPALVDWEHVGWGPPGADWVFFSAACSALGLRVDSPVAFSQDAVDFWTDEIPKRFGTGQRDQRLADGMLDALARLRRRG